MGSDYQVTKSIPKLSLDKIAICKLSILIVAAGNILIKNSLDT